MRTLLLASSQRCLSVDAYAWCKQTLTFHESDVHLCPADPVRSHEVVNFVRRSRYVPYCQTHVYDSSICVHLNRNVSVFL